MIRFIIVTKHPLILSLWATFIPSKPPHLIQKITQIPLVLLSKDEITRGELGQEQSFWFWKLAILHTLLAEYQFNRHPLRLTITFPPSPSCKPAQRN
jgi:hypothetical protein